MTFESKSFKRILKCIFLPKLFWNHKYLSFIQPKCFWKPKYYTCIIKLQLHNTYFNRDAAPSSVSINTFLKSDASFSIAIKKISKQKMKCIYCNDFGEIYISTFL